MKKELEYYGGDGYGRCPENGDYTVKHGGDENPKEVDFTKLSEAVKYFESLNESKAIWNNYTMELLECYTEKDDNPVQNPSSKTVEGK